MRYFPHTESDIREMLGRLGLSDLSELFRSIPEKLAPEQKLNLPKALSEPELLAEMQRLAASNEYEDYLSFIGAGYYSHYTPAAVDSILQRSEFYTAYTPYQPEMAQGTLQSIFEFQTMVCQLLEMEVANASMYDGASACAEAALMCKRIKRKRSKVLMARSIHPEYRTVTETYLSAFKDDIVEVAVASNGRLDIDDLKAKLEAGDAACLIVGSPNYFGVVEDLKTIEPLVHEAGALLVVTFSEALAYGMLRGPGAFGADIVCGEGQSFLGCPSFGGPGIGLFATRQKLMRQMPGRLCGQTLDRRGKVGYVLTLSTREQHIRREKATSNICSNQALCALATTIFLALMGRKGINELACHNLSKAEYLRKRIAGLDGYEVAFDAPTFNEFTIKCERVNASEIIEELKVEKILPGLELKARYPEYDSHLLINVTELHKEEELDMFIEKLDSVGKGGKQ